MSHPGSSSAVTTELYIDYCRLPLHQWRLLGHLPGLTELRIKLGRDLTSTPEIIQHLSSLQVLSLIGQEDDELPKWLGELTSLERLDIDGYEGIKELDDNIRKLTKLQKLELCRCHSMASLPNWLIELTSLKTLVIKYSEGIRFLPEGIQQLSNLHELHISNCHQLKRWCELEENKMKLAHITTKVSKDVHDTRLN